MGVFFLILFVPFVIVLLFKGGVSVDHMFSLFFDNM